VCCQVEVSATSWPLVQGSPTDCGASLCVTSKPHESGARIKRLNLWVTPAANRQRSSLGQNKIPS
jgi:hypothetical protein